MFVCFALASLIGSFSPSAIFQHSEKFSCDHGSKFLFSQSINEDRANIEMASFEFRVNLSKSHESRSAYVNTRLN